MYGYLINYSNLMGDIMTIFMGFITFGLTYVWSLVHWPYSASPDLLSFWVSLVCVVVPMWVVTGLVAFLEYSDLKDEFRRARL